MKMPEMIGKMDCLLMSHWLPWQRTYHFLELRRLSRVAHAQSRYQGESRLNIRVVILVYFSLFSKLSR